MDDKKCLADRTEFHWRQVRKNGREMSVCRTVAFFAALALGHYGMAIAGPSGGVITRGSGSIEQVGPRTDIDQSTRRLDIDWTTFSTRVDESVNFHQPGRLSTAINRVVGGVPSELRGALNANGRVFIINQSGITFHQSSRVNVGALLATTAGRLSGEGDSLRFDGAEGAVINHGNINVSDGGFALLVAPDVANTGYIQADLGQVTLASGKGFSIDLRGDGLISFKVDDEVMGTVVNAGMIRARSGVVQLSAADAQDALAGVINMGGIIDADAIADGPAGSVLIHGGRTDVSGSVSADGPSGGRVRMTGDHVSLSGAQVSASGPGGGGEILIGGDYQGGADTYRSRTTSIDAGTRVGADATNDGDGGYVIVWSDGTTTVHGAITARGGPRGGDGGFIETSGKKELVFTRSADASAPHGAPGTWLLDPENIDIGRGEADAIEGSLNQGNNVQVKTSAEGEGEGDIAVNASITKSEGGDAGLSMTAHGKIDVNAPITSLSGKLDVNLQAAKAVNVNSDIVTNGGSVQSLVTGVQYEAPEPQSAEAGEVAGQTAAASADNGEDEGVVATGDELPQAGNEDDPQGDGEALVEQGALDSGSEETTSHEAGVTHSVGDFEEMQIDHEDATVELEEPIEFVTPVIVLADDIEAASSGETAGDDVVEPGSPPTFSLTGSIRTGGGDVSVHAVEGVSNVDGVIDASNPAAGGTGGHVEVLGEEVNLGSDAVVDVSGQAGGGEVNIGGDYQGGGDTPTATKTTVAKGADIRADAAGSGDGGKIVVWADDTTVFRGTASARGGAEGGDGGFVEVSGRERLIYRGNADTRAPKGETGTLLLDPDTIKIADGGSGDSSTGAVDEGPSTAATATLFEKDLEAQQSDVVLMADKNIFLADLNDENTATGEYDGILDMQADLTLQVTGSSGAIWFEDLNDTIRVEAGNRSQLVIDGGTSNAVAVDVGNLEAIASDDNASKVIASIDVGAGGPVSIGDVKVTAVGEKAVSDIETGAYLRIDSGSDITIDGDILVLSDAEQQGTDKSADATARVRVSASGDANSHDSNARIIVTGDVTVSASAHGDGEPGVKDADADASASFFAAGDVWIQGAGEDGDGTAVTVRANAEASSKSADDARADAKLKIAAGQHVDSNASDNGGIRIDGNIDVDASADGRAQNIFDASVKAFAGVDLSAPDDVAVFSDSNDPDYDGQSGILIDGDIDINAIARLQGVDDFADAAVYGFSFALSYLDVFAGSHSSGSFDVTGGIDVDAFAESLDVKGFGNDSVAAALASIDIYAADAVNIDGDVEASARAVSAGGIEFDPKENTSDYTGGGRNGGAFAFAGLSIQAGVADPDWDGKANSAAEHEHSSNADIHIGGNVRLLADTLYRGDGFGRASASADGFMEASRDILIDGDIQVRSDALSSGTGPVYRDGLAAQSNVKESGDTYHLAYLADDARAGAYLALWAGMHSSGSVIVGGDVAVEADADMLNGSMAAKFEDSNLEYLDRAEASAYASASIYAADRVEIRGEGGIRITADALSSGELNGNAFADTYLGIAVGGLDPRWDESKSSANTHSHGSAEGELVLGDALVEARARYVGNAGGGFSDDDFIFFEQRRGEADAAADVYLRSTGDIRIDGDIDVLADAKSEAKEFVEFDADDIAYLSDFESIRRTYLGVGAPDADALASFKAYAGLHSSGSFDMTGTLAVHADADVTSNETTLTNYFEDPEERGSDEYAYLYLRSVADADADIEIVAANDIRIVGESGGSNSPAQAIDVVASAAVHGEHHGDAKAESEFYLSAGRHDSNGSVDIDGNVNLLASADYRGDTFGEAEAQVYGDVLAAGDISLDGDLVVGALARSEGTSEPYADDVLGSDEFDPKKHRLADDADAKIYLNLFAGLHSSGSLGIAGDIDIRADAELVNGSFAWDLRNDEGDSVEAEADVYLKWFAADNIHLNGDTIDIAADARSVGEFNGDADANVYLEAKAGDHGSNGAILVEADRFSVQALADYSGNALGGADAWAEVHLDAAGDITLLTDVEVDASANANGAQLDDPFVDENNTSFVYDSNQAKQRGDYLGVGFAEADARFLAHAGTHSNGTFEVDGTLSVNAAANLDSNLAGLDSNTSLLAELKDRFSGYEFDKFYADREADADVFVDISAADDVVFSATPSDDAIAVNADAEVAGALLEDAEANYYLFVGAGLHADSNGADNGGIEITGNMNFGADAFYSGDAGGSAEATGGVYLAAAGDIAIDGDMDFIVKATASGSGSNGDGNPGAGDADAFNVADIVAGTHSGGDVSISGNLRALTHARLVDGSGIANARAGVDVLAAGGVSLQGAGGDPKGDFRVLASAQTEGSTGTTNDGDDLINDVFTIPAGPNSPFGSDSTVAFAGLDAAAFFHVQGGIGDHPGNSSASVTVVGDTVVEARSEFTGKAASHNSASNNIFPGADFRPGGALAFGLTSAPGDINITGDISVTAFHDADVDMQPGAAENALALYYGYAGSHSSGDFTHTGNLTIDATAGSDVSDSKISDPAVTSARAHGLIGAANDITLDGDIQVTAAANALEGSGPASADALLNVLAALHGENSAQSGDIYVGGDTTVRSRAAAAFGDAEAQARLLMSAANSHDGFNDDLTVDGSIEVIAEGMDGSGSTDTLDLLAKVRLYAGDDVVLNGGPPTAVARELAVFGSNQAICGPGPGCLTGTDSTTVGAGSSQNLYTAMVDIFGHQGFEDPVPQIPDEPPGGGGGGGGPGFTSSGPVTPLPPLPPALREIVLRTVTAWLQAIASDPELFVNLPPGVLEDIVFDENGRVTFTQSFFEVYLPRIFDSDLRDVVPWPAELIDFLEASRDSPPGGGPGDEVAMADKDDSS